MSAEKVAIVSAGGSGMGAGAGCITGQNIRVDGGSTRSV